MAEIQSKAQKSNQFLDSLNEKETVYLMRQRSTGRMLVGRMLTEAQMQLYRRIQQAQIPGTPTIRSITKDAEDLYLEMEDYIQGVSLDAWMEDNGTLSENQAARVILQLCAALEQLHAIGIIHRDIKPGNIIVTQELDAYLVDFDISRIEKDGQRQDTRLLGTKGYAAPEQFGFKQTDCRADIYSLGVVLHRMLTGHFPGEGTVSPKMAGIIAKCISMEPAARYANVTALAIALGRKTGSQELLDERVAAKKSFLRKIPGFRSNNVIFEAIALVFYCFAAIVVAASVACAFESFDNFFLIAISLFFFFGAYLFVFDCFQIRTGCAAVEKHRHGKEYVLHCGAAILIWFILCFVVLMAYAVIAHAAADSAVQAAQTAAVVRGSR